MSIKKKILLVFCITALLFLTSLGGIIFYWYTHPSAVKPFIEKSVSRSTGTSFTIKDLSYSLKPLSIRAKEIILKPDEELPGFYMEISDLNADIGLEGPFGHKSLTFKDLKIDGFSFQIHESIDLPKITSKPKSPSFFTRILKEMVALFLFRDIKFQAGELVNGHIDAGLGDQTVQVGGIHAKLNPEHKISIECSVQIKLPSREISIIAPNVQITTDHAISLVEPEVKGLLTAQKMTFQHPDADIKNMDISAKLTYDHNNKKLTFEPADLHLKGVSLRHELETKLPLPNLHIKAEGLLSLQDSKLNVFYFHLAAGDILQSKGSLTAVLGPQTGVDLKIVDCGLFPQKLMPLLPDRTKVTLAPFTLSGPVSLHGNINGLKKLERWRWHSDLQANLKQNRFSYKTEQVQLNSRVTGNIKTEGIFPDIRISANVKGDETTLSGMGMELKPFKVNLSLSGKPPAYLIKDLALHIPVAKVAIGSKRELLIDDIHLHILKGRLDGEKGSLSLPEIRLDSSLLKNLMLSLSLDAKQVAIKLEGNQTQLIESALALNMLPSGWQFSGLDSFETSIILKEKGDYSFTSRLGFQELSFQNQDSSCMGEKISINANINGKIQLKNDHIAANISLKVNGGEILYDRFYLDLNKNAFFSSFEGNCDISGKSLQISNLRLGLKDILALDIGGTLFRKVSDNHLNLSVNIPKTSLKPFFQHFILEPFQTEKPFLADLNIGGTISADLKFAGSGRNWTVMGPFRWHEGELLLSDSGLSLQEIDLDLPIWYHHSVTSDRLQVTSAKKNSSLKKEPIKGMLSIKSMDLPFLPKQSLKLKLDAGPNMLSVKSATIFRIPGGNIQLGPVICRDLFGLRPFVETSLTLDSIDTKPLLSGIFSRPIWGTIKGSLDPIHLEGGVLKSHGDIKARVFDGEVILSDFGISGIFSSAPVFKLSAKWNDLSLEEITTDTSFGKIEGALRGHIKDLEIAYGQPQRFDLLLETVKKKGVAQKISVRAVDSIARIGGGQSPFMGLAGVFSTFFKKFPYKKIGVHAALENDIFRINGTIKEGGKEYLMKRGGISGVNIVNQSTDNRIRFKDMVKRIKRVTAPGASPLVK